MAGPVSLNRFRTQGTGAGLKESPAFKNPTTLNLTSFDVADEVLAAQRGVDLLHALVMARGERNTRPATSEDVLAPHRSLTEVSDTGLNGWCPEASSTTKFHHDHSKGSHHGRENGGRGE